MCVASSHLLPVFYSLLQIAAAQTGRKAHIAPCWTTKGPPEQRFHLFFFQFRTKHTFKLKKIKQNKIILSPN